MPQRGAFDRGETAEEIARTQASRYRRVPGTRRNGVQCVALRECVVEDPSADQTEPVTSTTTAATVVLVHGAWHGGWCFAKTVAALEAKGVSAIAPDLPGHGADSGPLGGLAEDAQRIREVIAATPGPVVLLGHSYGGLVISEAASDPVTAARVRRLVYLCAIVTAPGETFFSVPADHSRSLLGPLIRAGADGVSTIDTSDVAAARAVFFGDCSDDDAASAVANLSPQPLGNMSSAISGDPLATLPATYIRCTEDRTIPIEVQDALIASASGSARSLDTITLSASHSPFLSMPEALADHLVGLTR